MPRVVEHALKPVSFTSILPTITTVVEETTKHIQDDTFQRQLLEVVSAHEAATQQSALAAGTQQPRRKDDSTRARLSVISLSSIVTDTSPAPNPASVALQLDLHRARRAYAPVAI